MQFEYNGNLLEDERINLVAKEIIDKYPEISLENAQKAAMLEGKITTFKSTDDELNRLYNIMLVNSDNKKLVTNIYKDYLYVLRSADNKKRVFVDIMKDIYNYLTNNKSFPLIGDYE